MYKLNELSLAQIDCYMSMVQPSTDQIFTVPQIFQKCREYQVLTQNLLSVHRLLGGIQENGFSDKLTKLMSNKTAKEFHLFLYIPCFL